MEKSKESITCYKKSISVDLYHVEFLYLLVYSPILEVFMKTPLETFKSCMRYQLSDLVLKTTQSTGLLETLGGLTGVKLDSSESSEVSTTLLLSLIVHGQHPRILGLTILSTLQQRVRRTILGMLTILEIVSTLSIQRHNIPSSRNLWDV